MGKENKEWKKELDEGMKWGVKCTVIIIWSLSAANEALSTWPHFCSSDIASSSHPRTLNPLFFKFGTFF